MVQNRAYNRVLILTLSLMSLLNNLLSPQVLPLWSHEMDDEIISVVISSSGERIAVGSHEEVCLLDELGNLLWSYKIGFGFPNNIDISSDGKYVAVGSLGRKVFVFDSFRLIWIYETRGFVESVSIS